MLPTAALVCLLLAPTSRPPGTPTVPTRPAPAPWLIHGTVGSAKGTVGKAEVSMTTTEGTVYRIAPGGAAKLLTANDALHGRLFRLTAEAVVGGGVVQVKKVQTIKGGKVFDVDYWCENCQMSYDEPGACKCCMGETVLRERPAKTD